MADPFSTVVAAVSFVDITIRACRGINVVIGNWNDAPNAIQLLRQTVQNVQCTLESLRLYVIEYESSQLFIDHSQLLPEVVKSEIRGIGLDLSLLQRRLPPADTQTRRTQRLKWIFDEKKILDVVRRLDSRQIAVVTALQSLAQRNGIEFYEQISGIRKDLGQIDTASSSQLEEAKSTIGQRLNDVIRIGSDSRAELQMALDGIRTLVKPISDNHAKVMDKLNDISTTTLSSERHMQSCNTLQATSTNAICRMLRAELTSVVMPTVEEHLNSYKANQNAQLESIRKSLDQIVSDFGHLSVDKNASLNEHGNNQSPEADPHDTELQNDAYVPHCRHPAKATDNLFDAFRPGPSDSNLVVQSWTLLWRRTWIFRWPIGVMIVHVSFSHCRSPGTRRTFEAFANAPPPLTRYSSFVSITFRPAPSFLIARGISLECTGQQDQRGFYQICPMLATFAIIPDDAEAIKCVIGDDVDGLRALFDAGLAAPTDRNDGLYSLLHYAALGRFNRVGKFLLQAGADPSATECSGMDCLGMAVVGCFENSLLPASEHIDDTSFIRNLRHNGAEFKEYDKAIRLLIYLNAYPIDEREYLQNLEMTRNSLFSLTSYLVGQGWDVNEIDDSGMTMLMRYIDVISLDADFFESAPVGAVLFLCLLNADVSIRTRRYGSQALHILFSWEWSAKYAQDLTMIAYILIHYGGADIYACDYDGLTPTTQAVENGWWEEWATVLKRCGYNPDDVYQYDFERLQKSQKIGDGESTAVDTDDILEFLDTTVTRRKTAKGDRLID